MRTSGYRELRRSPRASENQGGTAGNFDPSLCGTGFFVARDGADGGIAAQAGAASERTGPRSDARSSSMFNPVDSKVDFPAQEQETLAWWEENGIVDKYLKRNEASEKRFSFIDGPITANNPMGVHHGWGRTYKDLFQRFKTMQGYRQRYQNGFDGQGLWIEVEVEKELGFESKRDIEVVRHRQVRRAVQGAGAQVRRRPDVAVGPARLLDGLGQLVPHDVGREQLHDLALSEGVPRARLDIRGHRRHAVVPAVRDGAVAARDRHRGLQGDRPSRPLPALPAGRPRGRVAAGLDDDAVDADEQHGVLRSP